MKNIVLILIALLLFYQAAVAQTTALTELFFLNRKKNRGIYQR